MERQMQCSCCDSNTVSNNKIKICPICKGKKYGKKEYINEIRPCEDCNGQGFIK